MKILKSILYFILFLIILLTLLVALCAVKPELAETIADTLYSEKLVDVLGLPGASNASGTSKDNANSLQNGELPAGNMAGNAEDIGNVGGAGNASGMGNAGNTAQNGNALADANAQIETFPGNGENTEKSDTYISPDKSDIQVPEAVAGKNGYQQLTEENRQIGETEAEKLQRQLGTGETGDDLSFDPLFYPYYAMLDERKQHIYRQVYANAQRLCKAFAPVEPVFASEMKEIMEALYNDHPELFWMDTAYACVCKGNGQCIEIDLKYNKTANNFQASKEHFDAAAQSILIGASELQSEADKEKYVHDSLVDLDTYALSAEMNQSAYSALVNGRTVCAGYARAFQYLMQQLGIPCYYCTGYAGESHAWDIIKLGNDFYNVDVTWDDTDEVTYDYYNKSDADYADTHMRQDLSVNLPPCNGTGYQVKTENEEGLRTAADAGFTENQILYNLNDYFVDCYSQILDQGTGSYSFSNVIAGSNLLSQWEEAYSSDMYKDAYVKDAMRVIGAKNCQLRLQVEQLADDRYLITHAIQLK